jgi:hypothetical protein
MTIDQNSNPFQRYEQAPPSDDTTSAINGVFLYSDEEVTWNYTYFNGKRNVSGYTINKKINLLRDEIIERINNAQQ